MFFTPHFQSFLFLALFLLSACAHPISEESREQISTATTSTLVAENPSSFVGQHLLVGGSVVAIEHTKEGSVLEIMEWHLNRLGEPTYPEDNGRRFLIKTNTPLNSKVYETGTLITLAGAVLGQESRLLEGHTYNYPVIAASEIHLWESPFRYGVNRQPDPVYPRYIGQDEDLRRHPYDSSYGRSYPYTPYWYRGAGN